MNTPNILNALVEVAARHPELEEVCEVIAQDPDKLHTAASAAILTISSRLSGEEYQSVLSAVWMIYAVEKSHFMERSNSWSGERDCAGS